MEPTPAYWRRHAELRRQISDVCAELDKRWGNAAGVAERGVYYWYWPPSPSTGLDVLVNLHRDALAFLASAPPVAA
jgi:hypothetical protein